MGLTEQAPDDFKLESYYYCLTKSVLVTSVSFKIQDVGRCGTLKVTYSSNFSSSRHRPRPIFCEAIKVKNLSVACT